MNYITHSHRYAFSILENEPEFQIIWNEIKSILSSITENDIIEKFNTLSTSKNNKSISVAINKLFHERFTSLNWFSESKLFQDDEYEGETWRLDFAKDDISVEIAFNHSTVIAWNLLKPVLASELNHVNKALQTKIGVVVTATQELKKAGGFDSAIGTFDKFVHHLKPLNNQLTVPVLIIGLNAPSTFKIVQTKDSLNRNIGRIEMIADSTN